MCWLWVCRVWRIHIENHIELNIINYNYITHTHTKFKLHDILHVEVHVLYLWTRVYRISDGLNGGRSAAGVGLPSTGAAAKATVRRGQVVVELQTSPGIGGIHIRVDFYWFPLASWNICHKFSQFQINWINLEFTGTPWLNTTPILLPYCSHKKSLFLMEKMPSFPTLHDVKLLLFLFGKMIRICNLIGYPSHYTWVRPRGNPGLPEGNMTWWKGFSA